jgi:hypothetical protein
MRIAMKDAFDIRLTRVDSEMRSGRDEVAVRGSGELAVVLSTICRWLARHGVVLFEVGGFGQVRWPVDVAVDLAVVAEQVPAVLEGLALRRTVDLDFYEQGIQRLLTFEPADNDQLKVSCRSGTAWTPIPDEYLQLRSEVLEMFAVLGKIFIDTALDKCPGPASHETFQAWRGQYKAAVALLRAKLPS